jgi:hypothetical protein
MRQAVATAVMFALLIVTPALAADDVLGWQGTRWGTKEAATRKTLEAAGFKLTSITKPEDRRYVKSRYAPFETQLTIGDTSLRVVLLFHEDTQGLDAVLMTGVNFKEDETTELLPVLKEKYGEPFTITDERVLMKAIWKFTTTTIELTSIPSRGRLAKIQLYYAPTTPVASKKAKDKL